MLRNNADARRCSYFELGPPVDSLASHADVPAPRQMGEIAGGAKRASARKAEGSHDDTRKVESYIPHARVHREKKNHSKYHLKFTTAILVPGQTKHTSGDE